MEVFWTGVHELRCCGSARWCGDDQGKRRYREWLVKRFGGDASHFAPVKKKLEFSS